MESPAPNLLSLYLHIPFCAVKCSYCAFNVYANLERLIPAYVAALCRELRLVGRGATLPVHTIYVGGGTPSLLSPPQLGAILAACRESFTLTDDPEISLEVNPEQQDAAWFEAIRALGINRLSIGMQSAHASELKLFARQHTPDAPAHTLQIARSAGFDNISLDVIYGVPNQTLAMWQESVQAALACDPDHLSLYALQVEPDTPFADWVARGKLPSPDDDLAADMYDRADEMITRAGLTQYEISSFSRPGRECRHNLQYWRHGDYLGLGAGAHGFAAGMRYTVTRAPGLYIEQANREGETVYPFTHTVETRETITREQAMDEVMITGLRVLHEGIDRTHFARTFGVPVEAVYGKALIDLEGLGMITVSEAAIRLTRRARLIANQVLVRFMR